MANLINLLINFEMILTEISEKGAGSEYRDTLWTLTKTSGFQSLEYLFFPPESFGKWNAIRNFRVHHKLHGMMNF